MMYYYVRNSNLLQTAKDHLYIFLTMYSYAKYYEATHIRDLFLKYISQIH